MPKVYTGQNLGEITESRGRKEPEPHRDVPPDLGCDLWPECLSCPLSRCRYELTYPQLLAALDELTKP